MSDGGWIGVASLLIMSFFAWLNKRDSLRHDTELNSLRNQNATQAAQITELVRENEACKEKSAITDSRVAAVEAAVDLTHKVEEVPAKVVEQLGNSGILHVPKPEGGNG